MLPSKRRGQEREKAWTMAKAAVHDYSNNPCAATEQVVGKALGKMRDLSAAQCKPEQAHKGRGGR